MVNRQRSLCQVPIVAIHKVVHGPARLAAFEEEARALAQARTGGPNVQVSLFDIRPQVLGSEIVSFRNGKLRL